MQYREQIKAALSLAKEGKLEESQLVFDAILSSKVLSLVEKVESDSKKAVFSKIGVGA